jgi:hypothetical protein
VAMRSRSVAPALPVPGGTGNARSNPQPAETPRRLVLEGGFAVDGGRDRRLEERARVLGFDDLRGYLQARCDAGHSVPQLAAELGLSDWQVQAALTRLAVPLAPRPERLAAQRRRYTEERIAARVTKLGFTDVCAYLADRVLERGWLLAEVAAELGSASADGPAAAGPPRDPPGAPHTRRAGDGRGRP